MSNSKSFLDNLIGKANTVQNFVGNILREPSRSPSQRASASATTSSNTHVRSHSTPANNTSSVICSGCPHHGTHGSTCFYCGDLYCKSCLIQKVNLSAERAHWLCRRCTVFSSNESLNWDKLMTMSVKDLRWFLSRNELSDHSVKEKEQLVELILNHYGGETGKERSQHDTDCPKTKQDSGGTTDNRPQSSTRDAHSEEKGQTSVPESPNHYMKRPPPSYDLLYPSSDAQHERSPSSSTTAPDPLNTSDRPSTTEGVSPPVKKMNNPIMNRDQRVHLDDIENEEMLHQLSIKQLKDLLTCNFVNFKGCVERSELLARAVRLWTSHQENKRLAEEQNLRIFSDARPSEEKTSPNPFSDDDKLCRICMENVIDCVFLDCGHMLTCVKCGKVLAECPICRQNIVRVVRVFHS